MQKLEFETHVLEIGTVYQTTTDAKHINTLPYKVVAPFTVVEAFEKWGSKYAKVKGHIIHTWDEEPDFTEWLEAEEFIKEVISIYPVPADIHYNVGEHVIVTQSDYDGYDLLSLMLVLKEFNTKDQLPLWAASHGNISDGNLKGELTTKSGEPKFWEWLVTIGLVKSVPLRELHVGEDTNIALSDRGDDPFEHLEDEWEHE